MTDRQPNYPPMRRVQQIPSMYMKSNLFKYIETLCFYVQTFNPHLFTQPPLSSVMKQADTITMSFTNKLSFSPSHSPTDRMVTESEPFL